MKNKSRMRVEIKDISPEGTFEGLLSPYGNVDQGADVVEAGAYVKTLKDQGNTRPLLWQHKADVPIGEITLDDRADGLWCKGQLLMQLPEAQKAYLLIKARIVKGLSIGFEAIKDSIEAGVRRLKEIKLYEGSVVTFPMNEMALITSIKGKQSKGDFNEEFTEQQVLDADYQMFCALRAAQSSTTYSDLSKDEKLAAMQTILQQYSDAYMANYPNFLDALSELYGGMEMWSKKRVEYKAGAKWSSADRETYSAACDMIKSAHDSLRALLGEEAGSSTSDTKAALQPEPVPDHSAAARLLDEIESFFEAA